MIIMNRNTSPIEALSNDAIANVAERTLISQYPEEELARFKALYAEQSRLPQGQIELANGSDEWLQKLMIQFGAGGVLALDPDFFMYEEYAQQIGRQMHYVTSDQDYNFDTSDILVAIEDIHPSLFILSNPHNPTGYQFPAADLQQMADAMEAVAGYFVIDEAYIEFGEDYQRPINPNVIIVRTLSKMYAMAGLRIGIAYAQGATFDRLTAINHPYPVNNISLNLANALFEDPERLKELVAYQKASRERLVAIFQGLTDVMKVKDTQSNFVFTYGGRAKELGEYLVTKGFLPRMYSQENLANVVRYSIIRLEDYDALEAAINEWRNA